MTYKRDKALLTGLVRFDDLLNRGGVEDTRLEAKAKDTKKGQGQPFRGQTLSRPRTMDTSEVFSKKVFKPIFQVFSKKKTSTKNFLRRSTKFHQFKK